MIAPPCLHARIRGKSWPHGPAVLGEMDIQIAPGEIVAITGPSGSGKSTLLSILAGLDHTFDGHLVTAPATRLGMVFQSPRLLPWRTARQNVALALIPVLGHGPDVDDTARAALAGVGLDQALDVYPAHLSLGMARRVALARALAIHPTVLMLDEAFVSLDHPTAHIMRQAVAAQVERRNMAVVMVSHDPADLAALHPHRILRLAGSPARLSGPMDISPEASSDDPGSCPP